MDPAGFQSSALFVPQYGNWNSFEVKSIPPCRLRPLQMNINGPLNRCLSAAQFLHAALFFRFLVCSPGITSNILLFLKISTSTYTLRLSIYKSDGLKPLLIFYHKSWKLACRLGFLYFSVFPCSLFSFFRTFLLYSFLPWWSLHLLLFSDTFYQFLNIFISFPSLRKKTNPSLTLCPTLPATPASSSKAREATWLEE